MKFETVVNGLSDIINDYIEGRLDVDTARMLESYFAENSVLDSFVKESQHGKIELKKAYTVMAADDFEEKLAKRIEAIEVNKES